MTAGRRARIPWILCAVAWVLVAAILMLTILNRTLGKDAYFALVAFAMILGYSTVGAVLASRSPRNPIGWLMIAVGLSFAVAGFGDEYTVYGYETNPGSLPIGPILAAASNLLWLPMFISVILLVLLFPTGQVPSPRWRRLPTAILGLGALAFGANLLMPGALQLDVDARILNPFGVPALADVTEIVATVGWLGVIMVAAPLSVVALVLRYRRSEREERQQLRWLAYVAGTTAVVIVSGIATALVVGESFGSSLASDVFVLAGFGLVGIGVPVAMGIAVLRYRLYDLDLVIKKTVLYAMVAVVLSAAFVVIAVVIGRIAGRSQTGAIVAAATIGLAFWPALRLARRLADRIVYGKRATPYEVLADFSHRVGGSYAAEDVLSRMVQVLNDAVGARGAIVWLRVGNELRPAAVVPRGDMPAPIRVSGEMLPELPADAAVEVRDRGELLGALAVSMPPNDPMNPSRERLIRDLATQAGLVLRNVRLVEELRASRQRLVAAQDEERRRLERNIHDGAQQQLVALQIKQRLVEGIVERDPVRAKEMLTQLQEETATALEDLRDLARGIYPPLLADQGLPAALEAQARKSPVPVSVDSDGVGRFSQEVEAAVYFCALEALNNVAKYAQASSATVTLLHEDGHLTFSVTDDGTGFDLATTGHGTGLQGMADRLEAVGGELVVESAPGRGTRIRGIVTATEAEPT